MVTEEPPTDQNPPESDNDPVTDFDRWSDYRFNGLRSSLQESRDGWVKIRDLGPSGPANTAIQAAARGRVEGLETALRLLDTWVLGVQAEEADS